MSDVRVLALVGSLRTQSFNRKIAAKLQADPPVGVEIEVAEGLDRLPFFNEDLEADVPAAVAELRDRVAAADRILLITPEYNGSIPAVLKNAIDWLSRPFGDGVIKGKPVAVVGTSMGQYGGAWSHGDTRKSVKVAGASVVEDIELSQGFTLGADPSEDADTVAKFADAVAKLAVHETIA